MSNTKSKIEEAAKENEMGGCMSLNYCNRGGEGGHSGRRRHRNRRDQVECNGGNGGGEAETTADVRQQTTHRSPSFSNVTSTNGDNLVFPNSMLTNLIKMTH